MMDLALLRAVEIRLFEGAIWLGNSAGGDHSRFEGRKSSGSFLEGESGFWRFRPDFVESSQVNVI
jgi:hypothetical protein